MIYRKIQTENPLSRAMDHWAYWNQVKLDFSRRGKPTDNAVAESFLTASEVSASRYTGSGISKKLDTGWKSGGKTTTTFDLTAA
jgi:hypothetical protein